MVFCYSNPNRLRYAFFHVEQVIFYSWFFGGFLIWMCVGFCQISFLHLYNVICIFIKTIYYIDWFLDLQQTLHSWYKSHLNLIYDSFYILLNCWIQPNRILLRMFYACIQKGNSSVIFVWLWYQANSGSVEWVGKYSFFLCFLEEFLKNPY